MGAPSFPDDPRVDRVIAVYDALQRRDAGTFSFDAEGRISGLVVGGEDQQTLDEFLG